MFPHRVGCSWNSSALASRLHYPFAGERNMDSGYYVAYAGLASRMQALDVLAANLANASTAGFKAQDPFYQALAAAQDGEILSPLNQAVNQFGILGGSQVDLRSGSLDSTGNNLDLAMEGAAFFSVATPGGIRYTRNGSF